MEYIDGYGPLVDHRELDVADYPPPAFFTQLKALVQRMHNCGIAHGDLRRKNVLRTKDNEPYLVDFATAICCRGPFRALLKPLFRMLCRADRFAVLKLQRSYHPSSLGDDEIRLLSHVPWYLAAGRFLRKRLYRRLIKQRTWQQRFEALTACLAFSRVPRRRLPDPASASRGLRGANQASDGACAARAPHQR
jgi:hypothetical protein